MDTPPIASGSIETVELSVDRIATGGEGVARRDDGKVVFVPGLLPGETAQVEIIHEKKTFARGRVLTLTTESPDRIPPDCAHVADGCGGCDWRHVSRSAARKHKATVVADVLTRLGRLEQPDVRIGPDVEHHGRTTIRALVSNGRAGYRRRKSHKPVLVNACPATNPRAEDLLTLGVFDGAEEVTIRVGARTEDRLVIGSPSVGRFVVPKDVTVVGIDQVNTVAATSITEMVGDRTWQISARSFFQSSPEGAEALVAAVGEAINDAPDGPMVDLYAGVGLLGGLLAGDRRLTMVESGSSSVADARINVPSALVIESRVESWEPEPASVVIADPARSGLGAEAVAVLVGTEAPVVALVSCDAGSLGRDARLLTEAGYTFDHATTVDMFPNTSHIEVVSRFTR